MARTALELSREFAEKRIEGVFIDRRTLMLYTNGEQISHPVEKGYWFKITNSRRKEYFNPENLRFLERIE